MTSDNQPTGRYPRPWTDEEAADIARAIAPALVPIGRELLDGLRDAFTAAARALVPTVTALRAALANLDQEVIAQRVIAGTHEICGCLCGLHHKAQVCIGVVPVADLRTLHRHGHDVYVCPPCDDAVRPQLDDEPGAVQAGQPKEDR